uniref:Hexosyltransferase n=1 Tax=Neogobius melanostomus TaxID=47308 RepID=A0A8C6TIF9_9GOBI
MALLQTEDGWLAATKKRCFYRQSLIFQVIVCMCATLYCLNSIETTTVWKDQLWSHLAPTSSPPPEYNSPGPYLVEYPYKYSFIINEAKRCRELKPYLVLVVPVAPQNKADRQIIRDTWGAQKVVLDKKVALFFLLGLGKADKNELSEESKQYGDIIQGDFVDCYKNLTIKTMVMLEWLDTYCRNATYAMKIDSDMFLNVPKLLEMLQHTPTTNCLTGLVERAAMVHRYTSSKWFVPMEVFGGSQYPPYVLGLGYVLSLDLAKRLVEASRGVKALYIEDVYLGMCMQHLGLQPTDPPIPGAFHVFPLNYNRCQFSKIIATTLHQHTDRRQLWRAFTQPGPYC